mmetsp:Transcript_53164/g.104079  ORF Transcript_53164/g.104079 Transcript_53164/m.104079 type:complete len:147 (+) Transcript_53164:155-595(+)
MCRILSLLIFGLLSLLTTDVSAFRLSLGVLRFGRVHQKKNETVLMAAPGEATKLKCGVEVLPDIPEEKKNSLGISSWGTWGCGVSNFPWSYSGTEMMYIIEGEVDVTMDSTGEKVILKPGTLATFPDGISCVWDVKKPIKKHYNFI